MNRIIETTILFIVLAFLPVWSFESDIFHTSCPKNHFLVDNMTRCRPLLTCADLKNVQFLKLIGYGAVKWVFLGNWEGISMAVSVLKNPIYSNDFQEGLRILRQLSPNRYVVQLVGYCENSHVVATEYHHLNNANSLKYMLSERAFDLSMKLCVNFVEIVNYLHHSPIGVRVNCDSDSVEKILSQILVTHTLKLVLNDVDALPEFVGNVSISCGEHIFRTASSLVPPELIDGRGYSDKSDVWKIPDVCAHFFRLANADVLSFAAFDVTRKCKKRHPLERPTAREVVNMYREIFVRFQTESWA